MQTFLLKFTTLSIGLAIASLGMVGCDDSADSTTTTETTDASTNTTSTTATSNVLCNYAVNEFNSSASVNAQSTANWSCDSDNRNLTANGIPNHEVGTFPNKGNPNTISTQNVSASLALNPTMATNASRPITIGYALNGVKVEPGTGGSCGSTMDTCVMGNGRDSWRIEALGQSTFDFGIDMNNAHVQPTGQYHYHGMPEKLMEKLNPNHDSMVLVAWAMDGYPIYARYGYAVADDAKSSLVSLKGSYQLKTTAGSGRISTNELPLGTFAQDYEYVAGSGDLDECNGRTGVTPEFPNGTYYYMISDSYPYAPRCLKGTVANAGEGAGGPQGGQGGQPTTEQLFAEMDTNKDNKLAQSEVKGPLATDFASIDTNQDGFLTKAEIDSASNTAQAPAAQTTATGTTTDATQTTTTSTTTNEVEIALTDRLDGKVNNYCLDILGGGDSVNPSDGLQAHTCYSYRGALGNDQIFDASRFSNKQFYMPKYDVCMQASSVSTGASLGLASCDSSNLQQFNFANDGTIRPVSNEQLCVTASGETTYGRSSDHQKKTLELASCNTASANIQTWRARTSMD